MANEYTTFFTAYRHQPGFNKPDSHDALQTDVLESYLSGAVDANVAAQQITAPALERKQPANRKIGNIFPLLFQCVEERIESHSVIISLLKAIFVLPKPESNIDIDWPSKSRMFLGNGMIDGGVCAFSLFYEKITLMNNRTVAIGAGQERWIP